MNRPSHRPARPYNEFQHKPRPHFAPRRPFTAVFQPPLHSSNAFGQNVFNKEFWCETCDRDFRSLHQLEEHKQQHQKCNIDGCQFIAHPKVITKHIQMQHSSGLYSKIANLNNPEEIKKWREERKKKYPTQSNIDKKAAEIKEKIIRGEKLGLKTDRFPQRSNKSDLKRRHNAAFQNERSPRDNKRNIGMNPNPRNKNSPGENGIRKKYLPKLIASLPQDSNKLKPFPGIQDLIIDSDEEEHMSPETNFLIEDDDSSDGIPIEIQLMNSNVAVCGALNNLMCNYATSDEDNEKDTTASNTKKEQHKLPETAPTIIAATKDVKKLETENASDDGEPPEEVKTIKPNAGPDNVALSSVKVDLPHNVQKQAPLITRHVRQVNKRLRQKPPSTLLQKLLFREMRQERNMVLQCIRHIIKKNYFAK